MELFVSPTPFLPDATDAARVAALRRWDILDTPAEAPFDRIARLAAQVFQVPIAFVTFMEEERQFFKACVGVNMVEAPRSTSFCTHALEEPELLIVEDALLDARFCDNVFVVQPPHLRFYAGTPLRDADGFAIGTLCVFDTAPHRVTEHEKRALVELGMIVMDEIVLRKEVERREQVEREAQAAALRLRQTLDAIPDAIFRMEAHGTCVDFKPGEVLPRAQPSAYIGRSQADILPGHVAAQAEAVLRAALETGVVQEVTYALPGPEGERHYECRYVPSGSEVLAIVRDVTDTHRFKAEHEARARAEELLQAKSALLNNVSHELRTPLAGILGYAQIIGMDTEGEVRTFAEGIEHSAQRLLQTITALLDLAQAEAGEYTLHPERFDVLEMTRYVAGDFSTVAEAKGVAVQVEAAPGTDPVLRTDAACLRNVLNHLIGNAVKFTPQGSVRVIVGGDAARVRVDVVDTGIGIAEGFLPRLFEAFTQASTGLSRTHEGSGLGLALVRRLVTLMDGHIDVESTVGSGTRFTLTLPRHAASFERAA